MVAWGHEVAGEWQEIGVHPCYAIASLICGAECCVVAWRVVLCCVVSWRVEAWRGVAWRCVLSIEWRGVVWCGAVW